MALDQELKRAFETRFGGTSRIFRAPGRVNLIGEHTDYNQGYVLPAAIGFDVAVAYGPSKTFEFKVHSIQEGDSAALDLSEALPQPRGDWTDYIRGVELQFRRLKYLVKGANLLVDGGVPIGGGLSSSAALEVAVAFALLDLMDARLAPDDIAKLCQRAENEFVGAHCGIMDQYSAVFGRAGHALLLDCRTLKIRYVPIPRNVSLVICNTMVRHAISSGKYNERRSECEECVRYFADRIDGVRALRDVTQGDLDEFGGGLPATLQRRARHVISENARVLLAAEALQKNDLSTVGRLMQASHVSLRDDYEVSCPELNIMVDLASKLPGLHGARMTGGGFGGCTINLVESDSVDVFKSLITKQYKQATNIDPEIYVTSASDGAGIANLSPQSQLE